MTIAPDRIIPAARRTVDDLPLPSHGYAKLGACRDLDDDLFLEPRRRQEAKRICRTCPVRWDCALDAFRTPDDKAVRGAMDPEERRAWLAEEGIGRTVGFDISAVQGMLDAGVTWEDIGAVYGITAAAMQSRWKRHGPKADKPRRTPPRRTGPLPGPVDVGRITEMRAANVPWKKIAQALDISKNTAQRAYQRAGRPA